MAETQDTISNPKPRDPLRFEPLQVEMERRRAAAELLLRAGYSQVSIAAYLNVSQATISRWSRRMGIEGPKGRPRRGEDPGAVPEGLFSPEARQKQAHRPKFLTVEQLREVHSQRNHWTWPEFAAALFDAYGVRYSRSQASAFLAQLRKGRAA